MSASQVICLGGHDSSGRAGVDADREAAFRLGARARCVVTVWTEQDSGGVHARRPRPVGEWEPDLRAAFDGGARGLKLGLLGGVETITALVPWIDRALDEHWPVVVDPVLGASTGEAFLEGEALEVWRTEILGRPVVLTPNLPEAARLLGRAPHADEVADAAAREGLARDLLALGPAGLVLKGGHGEEDPVRDLVLEGEGPARWTAHPRLAGAGMRGSGCRHATAVLCGLVAGEDLERAAAAAGQLLRECIREEVAD